MEYRRNHKTRTQFIGVDLYQVLDSHTGEIIRVNGTSFTSNLEEALDAVEETRGLIVKLDCIKGYELKE